AGVRLRMPTGSLWNSAGQRARGSTGPCAGVVSAAVRLDAPPGDEASRTATAAAATARTTADITTARPVSIARWTNTPRTSTGDPVAAEAATLNDRRRG